MKFLFLFFSSFAFLYAILVCDGIVLIFFWGFVMDSNQKSALGILAAVSATLFVSSRMVGSFSKRMNSRGQTVGDDLDPSVPANEQEMREFLMELDFGGGYSKRDAESIDGIGHLDSIAVAPRGSYMPYSSPLVSELYSYALANMQDSRELSGVKEDLRRIMNDPYQDEQTKREAAEVYDMIMI